MVLTRKAKRLRRLMEIGDLTQAEVAQDSGCSQSYVAQMCTGRRRVTDGVLTTVERLASERARQFLEEGAADDT